MDVPLSHPLSFPCSFLSLSLQMRVFCPLSLTLFPHSNPPLPFSSSLDLLLALPPLFTFIEQVIHYEAIFLFSSTEDSLAGHTSPSSPSLFVLLFFSIEIEMWEGGKFCQRYKVLPSSKLEFHKILITGSLINLRERKQKIGCFR